MALPPLLKHRAPDVADTSPMDVADLQSRARARRRLIGAAVLLVIGVVSFPLLFESQPRPVSVDTPMVIPSREGAGPLAPPGKLPERSASGTVVMALEPAPTSASAPAPASAAAPVPAPASAVPMVAAQPRVTPAAAPPPPAAQAPAQAQAQVPATVPVPAKPVPKMEPKAESKADQKTDQKADAKADPKAAQRFVVQVGAFSDAAAVKDARQRVEALGFKTYTQDVQTPNGNRTRVRIGPFDSQADAQKALERLKGARLPGAVLTL